MFPTVEYGNRDSLINNNKSLILDFSLWLNTLQKQTTEKRSHLINSLSANINVCVCVCTFKQKNYLQRMIGNPETGHPWNEPWPLRIRRGFHLRAFLPTHSTAKRTWVWWEDAFLNLRAPLSVPTSPSSLSPFYLSKNSCSPKMLNLILSATGGFICTHIWILPHCWTLQ